MAKKCHPTPSPKPEVKTPHVVSQGGMCNSFESSSQNEDDFAGYSRVPTFAEAVTEGRKRYGMTKSELAKAARIDLPKISRIEAGKTLKPAKEVVCALSPYTGISATRLLMYAGYSGVYKKDAYYSKSGEVIRHEKIVADIYKADPDFLEALEGVSKLPLSDIAIMKQMVQLMKYENETRSDDPAEDHALKIFSVTKNFLSEQLPALSGLIRPSKAESQHVGTC